MDRNGRAILLGVCLADAYLNVRKRKAPDGAYKYESAEMRVVHSITQLEYCKHKAELVRSVLGGRFSVKEYDHSPPAMQGKSYRMCGFSVSNGYWKTVKPWLYPNGKKTYTREYLEKCDLHSAALWYMDDGHLRKHVNADGWISSCAMDLSTMCSQQEAEVVREWFAEVAGIEWRIRVDPRFADDRNRYLQANTKDARKLGEALLPFAHKSMLYKFAHVADLGSTSAGHLK